MCEPAHYRAGTHEKRCIAACCIKAQTPMRHWELLSMPQQQPSRVPLHTHPPVAVAGMSAVRGQCTSLVSSCAGVTAKQEQCRLVLSSGTTAACMDCAGLLTPSIVMLKSPQRLLSCICFSLPAANTLSCQCFTNPTLTPYRCWLLLAGCGCGVGLDLECWLNCLSGGVLTDLWHA